MKRLLPVRMLRANPGAHSSEFTEHVLRTKGCCYPAHRMCSVRVIFVSSCTCVYIHVFIHVCIYMCLYMCIYTCVYTCVPLLALWAQSGGVLKRTVCVYVCVYSSELPESVLGEQCRYFHSHASCTYAHIRLCSQQLMCAPHTHI